MRSSLQMPGHSRQRVEHRWFLLKRRTGVKVRCKAARLFVGSTTTYDSLFRSSLRVAEGKSGPRAGAFLLLRHVFLGVSKYRAPDRMPRFRKAQIEFGIDVERFAELGVTQFFLARRA